MRKARLAFIGFIAVAPAVCGSAQAQGLPPDRIVRNVIGCREWDVYKKMMRFVADGDREAFGKIVYPSIAAGMCRRFVEGETVRLTDSAALSLASCVRPKGATDCFWIPSDASKMD
ncbi:hypothetical protein V5F77_10460 [Xanthobacter sp. DSM 24535]|uniref:hypothetical protein n=1 Tax=Roseixanthobacter psychrophilus TaxID=3119917 RepID=UPI003728378E